MAGGGLEIAARLSVIPFLAPKGDVIDVGLVVLGLTCFSLIIGELVPKRLALNNAERIASVVAAPMRALSVIAASVGLCGHEGPINTLAFSPDGEWLATGSGDNIARLWNVKDPAAEPIVLSGHENFIPTLAFSPDGEWLATGSRDNTARLWNMKDPTAEPIVLRGHADSIYTLAFSPDGEWLATGSGDNTARLWNMKDPAAEPIVLRGHEGSFPTLAFSPDGEWLATSSGDNTARLWNVNYDYLLGKACQVVGRNFTQIEWKKYFPDDAYRKTCAQSPAPPSAISALIKAAAIQASEGQLLAALKQFEYAQSLRPDSSAPYLVEDADSLQRLCWFGGLYDQAADVLTICDQAVAADPTDGNARDSRGLVRALTGDTNNAIEDFQAFVEWVKAQEGDDAEQIAQRQQWVAQLQAGRNPFTPEVLEALKDE